MRRPALLLAGEHDTFCPAEDLRSYARRGRSRTPMRRSWPAPTTISGDGSARPRGRATRSSPNPCIEEVHHADIDLNAIEWPKVDLSRMKIREDVDKAILGVATAAPLPRPSVRHACHSRSASSPLLRSRRSPS